MSEIDSSVTLHHRAAWLRTVLHRQGTVLAPRDRDALTMVALHPGHRLSWFADTGSVPGVTGPQLGSRTHQLAREGYLVLRPAEDDSGSDVAGSVVDLANLVEPSAGSAQGG